MKYNTLLLISETISIEENQPCANLLMMKVQMFNRKQKIVKSAIHHAAYFRMHISLKFAFISAKPNTIIPHSSYRQQARPKGPPRPRRQWAVALVQTKTNDRRTAGPDPAVR